MAVESTSIRIMWCGNSIRPGFTENMDYAECYSNYIFNPDVSGRLKLLLMLDGLIGSISNRIDCCEDSDYNEIAD